MTIGEIQNIVRVSPKSMALLFVGLFVVILLYLVARDVAERVKAKGTSAFLKAKATVTPTPTGAGEQGGWG